MSTLSAFQSNAFQNNAFQIATGSGAAGNTDGGTGQQPGGRIVGGTFSRGRWHDLKEQLARDRARRLKPLVEAKKRKQRQLELAAEAVAAELKRRRDDETREVRERLEFLNAASLARVKQIADKLQEQKDLQDEADDERAVLLLLTDAEELLSTDVAPNETEDELAALLLMV